MNTGFRLQFRLREILDPLATEAEGIDADFLWLFIETKQRLKSSFPIPFSEHITPFWADPSIDWSAKSVTVDRELFDSPWRITRQLWERPDNLIQKGYWIIKGQSFTWKTFEDLIARRNYDPPLPASAPLPAWGEVLFGARKYFLE